MTRNILISLISFLPFCVSAQDSTNFFPHHVGDMWEYYFTDYVGDDTMQVFVVKDSVDSDSNHHVIQTARSINPIAPPIAFFWETNDYIIDTLNQVLSYFSFGSGPLPKFKLDAQQGDQWVLWGEPGNFEMVRVVTVYQDYLFNIQTTFKGYTFYLAEDSSDTTGLVRNYYLLAGGFGIVYAFGESGLFMWLKGAVIDNVMYGDTTVVSISSVVSNSIPHEFYLYQNYPNPFNPSTTIRFGLPDAQRVTLTIYSITGEKVTTLVDDDLTEGYHQIVWDGRNRSGQPVASGIYLYEMVAGEQRFTRKMLLAK